MPCYIQKIQPPSQQACKLQGHEPSNVEKGLFAEAPKRARPLAGQKNGDPFDNFHAAFVEDAVSNNVQTVLVGETKTHRTVTMAGFHQLRVNKTTHEMTFYVLQANGAWRKETPVHFRLLRSIQNWRAMLEVAWAQRMRSFLPKKLPEGQTWGNPTRYGYNGRALRPAEKKRDLGDFLHKACEQAGERRVPRRFHTVLSTILARGVWRHLLDPAALKLTVALFGPGAKTSDYNLVALHQVALAQRVQETPNLAPLLGFYLGTVVDAGQIEDREILTKARGFLLESGLERQSYLARSSRGVVQAVVTARRWDSEACYDTAVEAGERLGIVVLLNALGKAQFDAPLLLVKWLLRKFYMGMTCDPETTERVIRLIAAQSLIERKKRTLKAFIATDLPLVWDYLIRKNEEEYGHVLSRLQQIPKNATWASVMRAQQEWHTHLRVRREAAEAQRRALDEARYEEWLREEKRLRAIEWTPILEACVVDDFFVTPLISGNQLNEEAISMNHCVDDYRFMQACQDDIYRVFHIERGTARSTLQVSRQWEFSDKWGIDQHYGFENGKVPPDLALAGKKVLVLFQAAVKAQTKRQPEAA